MTKTEAIILVVFLTSVTFMLYKKNESYHNQKKDYYDCYNKVTKLSLSPMNAYDYSMIEKTTMIDQLQCKKSKYTDHYVKLIKKAYKR